MLLRPPISPLFPPTPLSRPASHAPPANSHDDARSATARQPTAARCSRRPLALTAPIRRADWRARPGGVPAMLVGVLHATRARRSEEHTSELQSRQYLVCRLL